MEATGRSRTVRVFCIQHEWVFIVQNSSTVTSFCSKTIKKKMFRRKTRKRKEKKKKLKKTSAETTGPEVPLSYN